MESDPPKDSHSTKKANKDLTPQERTAKRKLKKELKVQQKRARLETRLRHAIKCKNTRIEQETRTALQALSGTQHDPVAVEDTSQRKFVISICSDLQRKQHQDKETKQVQTEQAVSLLRHMTKGTQAKDMFQDSNALWGYARQKFFERAMLVCNSFRNLHPSKQVIDTAKRTMLWEQLQSIRQVCSVGCGPGNDAVGAVAFLKSVQKDAPQLERAVLLDWAMEDWSVVVQPLCEIISPTYIRVVDTASCDIAESLLDAEVNRQAKAFLVNGNASTPSSPVDLFLVSYLLTEVRGKWHTFIKNMIAISKSNTLFYFAEPTPWQLHLLCDMFKDELDFCWLDSSMDHPDLQPLENRLGPGVLLGRKR